LQAHKDYRHARRLDSNHTSALAGEAAVIDQLQKAVLK
jgi:hypothetical protein